MQSAETSNKMTPYPHLHKMASLKSESTQLYTRNNLSTLRKLTLPSARNQFPFLVSNQSKPNTDRKKSNVKANPFQKRPKKLGGSINSNFKMKHEQNRNIMRNELFRERNSVPGKSQKGAKMLRKGFPHKAIFNQRSNHSLYNSGKNHLFSKICRQTGSSLGGRDSVGCHSSPKLNQLKSDFGKLKSELDRKISRDNAKFLKEFDKFGKSSTQSKYTKPKLRLVQKEGQEHFGMKAFPKVSFSRPQNAQERFSVGLSCQVEKLSQNLTTLNTLQQLEKVRVFDVRSKWFKPKKSTNYSEKIDKKKRRPPSKQDGSLGKTKSRERAQNGGLMLSLRKKIAGKGRRSREKVVSGQLSSKQKSIDLYSKLKSSQQKSQKSIGTNSPGNTSFYKKIFR